MSSNQLPAQDGHSLHDASDALVTSSETMIPSIQHSARVITNSTNNVVLTTANSNLITQSKPPVGYSSMSSDSHVSLLTSSRDPTTSFVSTSLPMLPAIGSGIVQPSATVLPAATVVPMYGNQLPPISRFTGEEDCSELGTFSDWLEQFEAVAILAGWNEHAKLVNLTTRLRGTAYSFHRSCVSEQRSNYTLLVEQLRKRFTPVELTAIQSQRFHDRRQSTKESVDEFAQELKKLFRKAYFSLTKGGTEEEAMGQTVLANQFVSGLRSELKSKVVGFEGNLEQLLVRARFEEAKLRELPSKRLTTPVVPVSAPIPTRPSSGNTNRNSANRSYAPRNSSGEAKSCFNCGMVGHLKKACPYSKSSTQEAPGRVTQKSTSVANLTVPSTTDNGSKKQNIEDLRCALRKAELTAALEECTTTVHGVMTSEKKSDNLGPTITVSATVNGVPTEALVDTGSPVTILSLMFAMSVLSQEQIQFPSKEEWKMAMSKRLRAPDVVLRSYGGERLNVLAQLEVTISQGSHTVTITTLVQKDAPSRLLLGTDVLSSLGFYCTFQKPGQTITLLEKVTPDSNNHNEVVKTQGKEELKGESLQESEEADDANPDVKDQPMGNLLLAEDIRIPSRCRKVVKAVITTAELDKSLNILLFTPTSLPEGLTMTDTVFSYEENQHVCTVVENQNLHPVWLKKDLVLGYVESVVEHEEGEEATVTDNMKDFVSCVKETSCSDAKERGVKMLEMLNLQIKHLTVEQ